MVHHAKPRARFQVGRARNLRLSRRVRRSSICAADNSWTTQRRAHHHQSLNSASQLGHDTTRSSKYATDSSRSNQPGSPRTRDPGAAQPETWLQVRHRQLK
jgi:hypothetical protein